MSVDEALENYADTAVVSRRNRTVIAALTGPYARPGKLAKPDGRSWEGRVLKQARAELLAHIGGKPSPVQLALINAAAQLKLRLALMDRKFAQSGAQTEHDSRVYLAWVNTYGRMLGRLGLGSAAPQSPTIHEVLARRR